LTIFRLKRTHRATSGAAAVHQASATEHLWAPEVAASAMAEKDLRSAWEKTRDRRALEQDYEAEAACVGGKANILAQYLRRSDRSPFIIKNIIRDIAWHLLAGPTLSGEWKTGPGNRILRFVRRIKKNGRPPKKSLSPGGRNHSTPTQALANGLEIPLGQYLHTTSSLSDRIRHGLADVLDPAGTSEWKLQFNRPQRGFPRSSLRNELVQAEVGQEALVMYEQQRKSWKQIYYEMNAPSRPRKDRPCQTRVKKGVAAVRQARVAAGGTNGQRKTQE
jgi:hypothetical protein